MLVLCVFKKQASWFTSFEKGVNLPASQNVYRNVFLIVYKNETEKTSSVQTVKQLYISWPNVCNGYFLHSVSSSRLFIG